MKKNDKVILKTTAYAIDMYNPRNMKGVIVRENCKFSKFTVQWQNGIRNGYNENELQLLNQ